MFAAKGVVTGGGLGHDGQWVSRHGGRYLLPVRVLGRLFRGKFIAALSKARDIYEYLGRYTHRVGLSNRRLQAIDTRGVNFSTKEGR